MLTTYEQFLEVPHMLITQILVQKLLARIDGGFRKIRGAKFKAEFWTTRRDLKLQNFQGLIESFDTN
jgi:hypothetical protein